MTVDHEPAISKIRNWREGRELAALSGGPWNGCWYWRDELPEGKAKDYESTEQWIPNPSLDRHLAGVPGRVWRYTGVYDPWAARPQPAPVKPAASDSEPTEWW